MRLFTIAFTLLTVVNSAANSGDGWKYDVIHLKNGSRFAGMIVAEKDGQVTFKSVERNPGTRMGVIETTFDRDEVDRVERLTTAERKELGQRLDALDRRGEREAARAKSVQFTSVPWPDSPAPGRQYTGAHFVLVSNAPEGLVRRVVVRLEDVFQAYIANLVKRLEPARPTRIVLYRSVDEYRKWQAARGLTILNPAYYDPQRNEIVAASDLERLETELDGLRHLHQTKLGELDQYEARLRKHFAGKPPVALRTQVRDLRRRLIQVSNENETALDRLHVAFFGTLFHEAFHAYLDNYVYPTGSASVPRWLNEGLQIFETAIVETGELRVGHIDAKRLAAVQEAVKQGRLVSLRELLTSDAKQFSVAHAGDALAADRYFLASWALAYYLNFDRSLLMNKAFDRYVRIDVQESDKLLAFIKLVDEPLPAFERRFHDFLLGLREDGTVRGAVPDKK